MRATPRNLSRRLLLGLSLGPALLLLSRTARATAGPGDRQALIESFVEAHRTALAVVIAVGVAYLERHTMEHDRYWLASALERRIAPLLDSASDAPADRVVGNALRLAISEDFKRGDTVRVRRWLLSRTEARLFALGSLHNVE